MKWPLDRKDRDPAKPEFLVKRNGLNIVMHDRQIHEDAAPCLETFDQGSNKGLADSRQT